MHTPPKEAARVCVKHSRSDLEQVSSFRLQGGVTAAAQLDNMGNSPGGNDLGLKRLLIRANEVQHYQAPAREVLPVLHGIWVDCKKLCTQANTKALTNIHKKTASTT